MPNREDELIAWLRDELGHGDLLGDDAALLPPPPAGARPVATVDSQIAGVHHPVDLDPARVARRLLAVNLSDLAATGADPAHALLALSAPAGYDHRRFFTGLLAACREHGVTLAGGDLARTDPAVATLTLLGLLPPDRRPLQRSDARPGHALWVAGTLGESAAGRHILATPRNGGPELQATADKGGPELQSAGGGAAVRAVRRHLEPTPLLDLGRELARRDDTGAVMDLSDGLSTDLPRLCRASGVGAEVEAAALPTAEGFLELCSELGREPLDLALHGGEDYALLFTLPQDAEPPPGHGCVRIGRIVEGDEIVLRLDGEGQPLTTGGWDHLR